MQPSNSGEIDLDTRENPVSEVESSAGVENVEEGDARDGYGEDELAVDVTGKRLEFDVLEKVDDSVEGLYLYKNAFSLFPSSVGLLRKLRTLKFFGNELNLFPAEFGNLVDLERLQVKVSSPGLDGLGFNKLKGLRELELSKAPPRPSVITILSEIAGLKCLTRLSVCHFSIRYLPPEIGCLCNLEYLDLSFNKIKNLPIEISNLSVLISLKVANNKLVELPSSLSSLQRLENLDLSNNRLTSLGSLQLCSMNNLQYLHLQYNKLLDCSQIPPWICCNLEGNEKNMSNDDLNSSSVEMDVYETSIQSDQKEASSSGPNNATSCLINVSSSNSRCYAARRSSKRWKRRYYMQQRARQERLNNSRKWKGEGRIDLLAQKGSENCKSEKPDLSSETCEESASDIIVLDEENEKEVFSSEAENPLIRGEDEQIGYKDGVHMENCSCELESINKDEEEESCMHDKDLVSASKESSNEDKGPSSSEKSKIVYKSKRHSDRDLDNPKPCKYHKPTGDCSTLSRKYRDMSFCGIEDRLADGFYDAGRDRPFLPLNIYEQMLPLDSREVILLDRGKDEKLDATVLSAQALVSRLKRLNVIVKQGSMVSVDNLHIVSLLALFVSDHFGGSDKSFTVQRARKAVSGSNYDKPFVCTCSTGNNDGLTEKQVSGITEQNILSDLCEKALHSVKARRNSIVVPLGNLQFGVCRHRALLLKYLCDRMEPPIPCELVRGYLDFTPHAWNSILIKKGDTGVRMLVDACRPLDIREETDAEYSSRYIPLSRTTVPLSTESFPGPGLSATSFIPCEELEKTASSTVIQCKLGSLEAVAKVRKLETCGTSVEEIRNFEYSCIGEVRILGALRHSCIVEMYGHQISSKWILSEDGKPKQQVLQSAIIMEHVKGGSLKKYIEKMSENGEKNIPVDLALCIARDVACALAELHSRHIIHRDVKSENILIDLDDGIPVVKLSDFDRAVPLRSSLHTCCIGHKGIPPPDICVGTPRWMAPEVFHAMHERNRYGLEVDIWSYGCLLLELLTLQVPYYGLSEFHINELLQMSKRPPLPDELETLISTNEPGAAKSVSDVGRPEDEVESVKFLVDLFHRCTKGNPTNRPKAAEIYELLLSHTSTLSSSSS
ncbi:Leucine-rich repeat protein kinase family protein [Euphorbia peplus]|nr:Leucine-rich repeat protein kinase family protein [Euphorbia peplus]